MRQRTPLAILAFLTALGCGPGAEPAEEEPWQIGDLEGPPSNPPESTPPENPTCEAPIPLPLEVTLEDQDLSRATTPAPLCNGDLRPKLFYSATVPAEHRLWVTSPGVNVEAQASCDGGCAPDLLVNESREPRDVLIAAYDGFGQGERPFDLRAEAVPLAANRTCERAQVLRPGDVLRDLDMRSGLNAPFMGGCQPIERDLPLFFLLEIPIGEQLRVVARPHDADTTRLSLQAFEGTCAEHTCFDAFSPYFNSLAPESDLLVFSQGQNIRRVLIAVATEFSSSVQRFDLEVERYQP